MSYDTHVVAQGKGGCGKSKTAVELVQALLARSHNVLSIDTDPINQTLKHHKGLPVRSLEILNSDRQIDSRKFDTMIEWILEHEGPAVIDNGATSFVPVTGYLAETGAIDFLAEHGRRVIFHTVLVGGQAMDDTLTGLQALLASSNAPIVVWINEFFGPVERDGRGFTDSAIYRDNRDRIHGIVTLRRRNPDTYGRDIAAMSQDALTYAEALTSDKFGPMPRHRLNQIWQDINSQLEPILAA